MAPRVLSARGRKLITRTNFLYERRWFLNRRAPICADIQSQSLAGVPELRRCEFHFQPEG